MKNQKYFGSVIYFALISGIIATAIFFDYIGYSKQFHAGTLGVDQVLAGKADAPMQYRVLLPYAAEYGARITHLAVRHVLAILDGITLSFVCWIIFGRENEAHPKDSVTPKIVHSLVMVMLLQYDLAWLIWYQKFETLPTALYITATVFIMVRDGSRRFTSYGFILIALSIAESFARADIVVILHGGFLLPTLLMKNVSRGNRARRLAVHFICAGIGLAIQLYLSKIVYPYATYGQTPVIMLRENFSVYALGLFGLFIWPVGLTLYDLLRRSYTCRIEAKLLLAPTLIYVVVVFVVGVIAEVRLFLPFAIALLPATADAISNRICGTGGGFSPEETAN